MTSANDAVAFTEPVRRRPTGQPSTVPDTNDGTVATSPPPNLHPRLIGLDGMDGLTSLAMPALCIARLTIRRHDRLGGLLHEYDHAA